jgi:DNA-directed RNA polymerase subunit RPC12/RpoP
MAMAVDGPFWTKEDQEKEMAKYGCETCTANIKYDGQCAGCTNPELFAARCDSYWGVQKVVSLHVSNVHKPYCMYCLRETHDELGDFGDTCKECADKRLQKMMEDLSSKEENWDF